MSESRTSKKQLRRFSVHEIAPGWAPGMRAEQHYALAFEADAAIDALQEEVERLQREKEQALYALERLQRRADETTPVTTMDYGGAEPPEETSGRYVVTPDDPKDAETAKVMEGLVNYLRTCPNCKQVLGPKESGHLVPPSFGDPGIWICKPAENGS